MKSIRSICARMSCTLALAAAVALPVYAEDVTADADMTAALANTINQLDAAFFAASTVATRRPWVASSPRISSSITTRVA